MQEIKEEQVQSVFFFQFLIPADKLASSCEWKHTCTSVIRPNQIRIIKNFLLNEPTRKVILVFYSMTMESSFAQPFGSTGNWFFVEFWTLNSLNGISFCLLSSSHFCRDSKKEGKLKQEKGILKGNTFKQQINNNVFWSEN